MQDARILVVEDEPLIAQDIRLNLENLGYQVVGCVDNGKEAVAMAARSRPDLVLMDIVLAGEMDGIEAARLIGSKHDLPVVYLTAYTDQEFLERAKITDPLGYVLKPFTQRELLAVITMALYRARTERTLHNFFWGANICASVPDPVIAVDDDLRISFVNQAACEQLGLVPDVLVGKKWNETALMLPELKALKVRSRLQAAIKTSARWHADSVLEIKMRGERAYVVPTVEPIMRREKHVLGAMLLLRDVTAKRVAEEQANRLEQQSEHYLKLSGAMLMALDLKGRVTLSNPAACAVLGYPENKILGVDWFEKFIPKRGRVDARELIERIQSGEESVPVQAESRVLTRSGEERVIIWTIVRMQNTAGETIGVMGSGLDITERRRLEIAIERSRDFYLSLLEHLPLLVWRSDATGECDYFNSTWLDFTGRALQQEVGQGWLEGVHPDDRQRVRDVYYNAFEKRKGFSMEYRLLNKSGNYHTILDMGHPIYDLSNNFAGYIGGCVDIEEKHKAARDLRSLSRALQVLSAANEALIRAGSDEGLLQEICEIIVNKGGYCMAWIGLAEHDEARTVRPVAVAGASFEAIAGLNVSWTDSNRGRGPTGRAIRNGAPAVMRKVTEPDYAPWQEAADRFGYASSAAVPVHLAGNVIGALNIYAKEPDAFDQDELCLLENLADDLSYGLYALHEQRLLAEQTERNETILSTTRDGFWIVGSDGRILETNNAYCELSGYTRDELLAMSVTDVDAAESAEYFARHMRFVRERGHDLFQTKHRTKTGDLIDVEVNAACAKVGDGLLVFAFLRDISERKQAERALLESETKYRALFELANDAICLTHEDRFVDCNAQALAMFGASREQFVGETPTRFSPENQPDGMASTEAVKSLIERAYAGEALYFEWRHRRLDGTEFDAEVSLNRVRIAGSAYLQAIVRDVTERKSVERALRSAHRYLDALYQTSPDMILLFSADGRLTDVNNNALSGFGYARDEMLALDVEGLAVTEYGQMRVMDMFERAAAGEALDFEWLARHKNGRQFPVEVRLRRLMGDPQGLSATVLAVVRDMTDMRRVEAQLQAILDFSPALISIKDLEGRISLANRQFSVLTGDDGSSAVGRTVMELFDQDDAELLWSNDQRAVVSGKPIVVEETLTHHDGSERVYLSVKFPMVDAVTDKPSAIGAISTDITERKRAEEQIQHERDFSTAVLDTIGSVVAVMDRSGKIVSFNHAAQRLTGWSEQDMLGKYIWDDLLLPEQVEAVKAVFAKLAAGQFPSQYVNYWLTRTGEKRLLDWSNTVLADDQGCVEFVIATGIDITDRKMAEQGLARVETQWNQAIDFFVDPVYFVDMEDKVVRANAAFYSLTGLSPEQVVGKDITLVMHPGGEAIPCPVCAARRARQDAIITMEADQSPMKRPIEVMVRMIRQAPDAEPIGILMGLRDLSRQRQIEEELRRHRDHLEELVEERTEALATVNRELETFSYSVSHDLRAPLRAIDGFSQVLLEEFRGKLDARGQEYLSRVRNASLRMSQLIDDLLMLSRVTRNDMHRQSVDLSAIAATVIEDLRSSSPERSVKVNIEPDLTAQADARLIRIVLENLLGNAWKFTGGSKRAEISFYQEPASQGGAFVVEDNGVGFDMAYVDRMFSAFQRLHTESEFEGTGIGLATVQRIVHRHGGRVYARGEPGKGAQIFFTLPQEKPKAADLAVNALQQTVRPS